MRTRNEILRATFEYVYLTGNPVRVHFLTAKANLPNHLYAEKTCALDFGRDLALPTLDTKIGPEYLEATLSFNRTPFKVLLPWGDIFAIVGPGSAVSFDATDEPKVEAPPKSESLRKKPARGHLRLV